MRRVVELLARLERHALDRQRLELAGQARALERARAGIDALRVRLEVEHALAFELPGGPGPLGPYAGAARARGRELRRAEAELRAAVARAEGALRERLGAWKSLDLAADRLRERAEADEALRERLAAEEAAALRAAAGRLRTPARA